MSYEVLCLRPVVDFERAGAMPPAPLTVVYRALSDLDVPALMKQVSGLIIPAIGPKLPPALFSETKLKLLQVTGAGVDRVERSTLESLGIPVANVAGGSNSAVAEYAVTTASLLLRRFGRADAEIRTGNYVTFRAQMLADNLRGIEGLLVGVIGFGAIGVAVADAFHKMGCRIIFHDPVNSNSDAAERLDAKSVSLDELLTTADVVSLHLPLLPETKGIIGDAELAKMKHDAVLIQASRGGIVDETALAKHLTAGHLSGVAVDVYSTEPPTEDNPLLQLTAEASKRILFTPHIAGVTRQSSAFLFRSAWANIERVLVKNEAPLNRVF
jgi:phosphoglycerate dehydrogenase-like enzyme